MSSRLFICPKNQAFVEEVLQVLEDKGISECIIRTKSTSLVEIEVFGWNVLGLPAQVDILGSLADMNYRYLITQSHV